MRPRDGAETNSFKVFKTQIMPAASSDPVGQNRDPLPGSESQLCETLTRNDLKAIASRIRQGLPGSDLRVVAFLSRARPLYRLTYRDRTWAVVYCKRSHQVHLIEPWTDDHALMALAPKNTFSSAEWPR